jgi:hypothetical protein
MRHLCCFFVLNLQNLVHIGVLTPSQFSLRSSPSLNSHTWLEKTILDDTGLTIWGVGVHLQLFSVLSTTYLRYSIAICGRGYNHTENTDWDPSWALNREKLLWDRLGALPTGRVIVWMDWRQVNSLTLDCWHQQVKCFGYRGWIANQ